LQDPVEIAGGVGVLVRKAQRVVGLARTAEAVLLGAGVGLLTWAAAVSSGGAPGDPACWGTALASALLLCASWKIDLRPLPLRVARGIDRRLRLGGGFFTAWERERSGEGNDLSRLLSADLRHRLRSAEVVRAALPRSMPFLAAPLLGAAVLAAVLDTREMPGERLQIIAPVVAGVAAELRAAHEQGLREVREGILTRASMTALVAARRSARRIEGESAARAPDAAQRRALATNLDELAETLETLVRERPGSPSLRRRLARAATLAATVADRARLAWNGARDPAGSGAGNRPGSGGALPGGRSAGQQARLGSASGEVADDISSPDLANAAGDGTMSAPDAGGGVPGTPRTPVPRTAPGEVRAGGVAVGRWWPARHADLVGRWVEDRRSWRAKTLGDGSDPDD